MKTKGSFWMALTLFSLFGQIAWVVENMYFNVFIYKMFHASAADISAMVSASAVTATLTAVCMGALSDKIGKRKLFICSGYILWGVSIFSFVLLQTNLVTAQTATAVSAASLGVTLTIVLDCVMTFFGSTANDAAFNAWLTDSTNTSNRGLAEGINAMMPLVSVLTVFGGFLFLDLNQPFAWTVIFTVVGSLMTLVGILGFFIIKEPPIRPSDSKYWQNILYGFKPSTLRDHLSLYLLLCAFILFNISIQIFMPYLILYYEISLGMKDYVMIMAPAIIIASAVTVFWGKFYDKKGFVLPGTTAVLLLSAGYTVLYLTRTTLAVFIGSLFMMSGYLAGMAVFGALIRDNTPCGKAGQLQGIRIFAQVLIPGIVGPFIGKTVLQNAQMILNSDGTQSFIPNQNIFLAALPAALAVLPFFFILNKRRKRNTVDLTTPYEEVQQLLPFSQYPRPQLKRDSYLCLNGEWDFEITTRKVSTFTGKICVPFPPESRLSGVHRLIQKDNCLIYRRTFCVPPDFIRDKVLLHIGACDQFARVSINQKEVGNHIGGYLPFTLDITEYLTNGENSLCIEVWDPLCTDLPYGKQSKKPGGMWYTKISGIWQTVWIESVCEQYIRELRITPDLTGIDLQVIGGADEKILLFSGKQYTFTGDHFRLNVENAKLWTPDSPHLYYFSLLSGKDRVESYFGLRTIESICVQGKPLLCLNGKPFFFHGLLDQGYFSDGIFLPATPDGFIQDILIAKSCGFNMLRKHIKLEPDLFYYECDRNGILVFQDMINNGKYNFWIDTALPTVFLKKGVSHYATKRRKQYFEQSCDGILRQLYNHPSVVYYTVFNEGWGQFSAAEQYLRLKAQDPTRIYDTASGWFREKMTDVQSEHVYFKPIHLDPSEKPLVLSEFGGYSYRVSEHCFNLEKNYGYRLFKNQVSFQKAILELYREQIFPALQNGLCATVLTQLSDVEDETNGIITYDRRVLKVDREQMKQMAEQLYTAFEKLYK